MAAFAPVTDEQRRSNYIRRETIVGVLVNTGFSVLFAFLVFHGRDAIALWGLDGIAFDFIPQTFVISMMTVLVCTQLTRRRIRDGTVPAATKRTRLPSGLFSRALVVATSATLVFGGLSAAVLAVTWTGAWQFSEVLLLKICYGACVAAGVAQVALRAALRDGTQ